MRASLPFGLCDSLPCPQCLVKLLSISSRAKALCVGEAGSGLNDRHYATGISERKRGREGGAAGRKHTSCTQSEKICLP